MSLSRFRIHDVILNQSPVPQCLTSCLPRSERQERQFFPSSLTLAAKKRNSKQKLTEETVRHNNRRQKKVQKIRLHSGASNGLRFSLGCSVNAVYRFAPPSLERLRPRLLPVRVASSEGASSSACAFTRLPARHSASAQAASSSQGGSSKGRFL
ncbi:uncharacterized protein BKA78DRAFT_81074 [Phyllosticta capitalensis]|uniref:uncharacterized protein n=1 Tax=Phyllosticta capitalensis TaxID=121624 RepID=UPI00313058D6